MAATPPDPDAQRREMYRLSGLGLEFGSSVIGGALLGLLLDWWLKTMPWLLMVGAGLGFMTGLFRLVAVMKQSNRSAGSASKPGR